MRNVFLILTILLGIYSTGSAQDDYKIPENTKKILFLGNSITYAGSYVSYIEAYLTLRYPEKHYEFINVGLPSETVSGLSEANHAGGKFPRPDLHERLKRVLDQTKPDLVFANYGMNDGIYLPFDDIRFQKYRDGLTWLNEQVTNTGASIIFLTPPIFDERKGAAYANVLDMYSDWLISCRYTRDWEVADLHWPMRKYLEDQRQTDSTFVLANDGVHPNKLGHWIMTKQVLLFLGEQDLMNVENAESAMSVFSNGEAVLKLVEERQAIMKDAWLTETGHERPGMKTGLPMKEAKMMAAQMETQIQRLLK